MKTKIEELTRDNNLLELELKQYKELFITKVKSDQVHYDNTHFNMNPGVNNPLNPNIDNKSLTILSEIKNLLSVEKDGDIIPKLNFIEINKSLKDEVIIFLNINNKLFLIVYQ